MGALGSVRDGETGAAGTVAAATCDPYRSAWMPACASGPTFVGESSHNVTISRSVCESDGFPFMPCDAGSIAGILVSFFLASPTASSLG